MGSDPAVELLGYAKAALKKAYYDLPASNQANSARLNFDEWIWIIIGWLMIVVQPEKNSPLTVHLLQANFWCRSCDQGLSDELR